MPKFNRKTTVFCQPIPYEDALLKYYRLRREDSIAFGDGDNDMSLLAAADTAVAMKNACEDLKSMWARGKRQHLPLLCC